MERISRLMNSPSPVFFPKPFSKIPLLLCIGNPDTVIVVDKNQSRAVFLVRYRDLPDMFAMPERVIHQVLEHFFEQRIGIDFEIAGGNHKIDTGKGRSPVR